MDVDMEFNRCGITNLLCPSKRKQTLHSTQCILVGSRGNRYLQFHSINRLREGDSSVANKVGESGVKWDRVVRCGKTLTSVKIDNHIPIHYNKHIHQ